MYEYTQTEVDLLARLMRAEAVGEGEEGMLMVGNVVVNRVNCGSLDFKNHNSIYDVIYQTPKAFAGVNSELFKAPSTLEERALAIRCLEGEKFVPASNALWFYSSKEQCRASWFDQPLSGKYLNHCFYNSVPGACESNVNV